MEWLLTVLTGAGGAVGAALILDALRWACATLRWRPGARHRAARQAPDEELKAVDAELSALQVDRTETLLQI